MRLKEVIEKLEIIKTAGNIDVQVSTVCWHTSLLADDCIFVARRGNTYDPFEHIGDIAGRAACIVTDRECDCFPDSMCMLMVKDIQEASELLSDMFFGSFDGMRLIGVTGTNGKTSVVSMIAHILKISGKRTGVMGTIDYSWPGSVIESFMTTPDKYNLRTILHNMFRAGCEYAVFEVSSHALELGRLNGLLLDFSVYTNLTPEHLDFHHDIESYARAKNKIHSLLKPGGKALINADDRYSAASAGNRNIKVLSSGVENRADYYVKNYDVGRKGIFLSIGHNDEETNIYSPLRGSFNVYNLLSAFAVAHSAGIDVQHIKSALECFNGVPGRMEMAADDVFVDYAHTSDALEKVLKALLDLGYAGIITVFGCGGMRDRSKRCLMGRIAEQLSSRVIITDDNPRQEDPDIIFDDIRTGLSREHIFMHDRKEAIFKALSLKEQGYAVLIAGKGHENYQLIGREKRPFSDRAIVQEYYDKNNFR